MLLPGPQNTEELKRSLCWCVRSYFNRDNVGLPGFAAFYRNSSLEERVHAQQLMDFQVFVTPSESGHTPDCLHAHPLCYACLLVLSCGPEWAQKCMDFGVVSAAASQVHCRNFSAANVPAAQLLPDIGVELAWLLCRCGAALVTETAHVLGIHQRCAFKTGDARGPREAGSAGGAAK